MEELIRYEWYYELETELGTVEGYHWVSAWSVHSAEIELAQWVDENYIEAKIVACHITRTDQD